MTVMTVMTVTLSLRASQSRMARHRMRLKEAPTLVDDAPECPAADYDDLTLLELPLVDPDLNGRSHTLAPHQLQGHRG